MSYNAQNHTEQGGASTVIDGTLTVNGTLAIADGASVTGIAAASLINDLTTGGTDKALTAEQGKTLNTAKVAVASIVNDLTTGGTAVPLSAEQGKTLNTAKVAVSDIVNDLTTGGTAVPLSAEQGKTLGARQAANLAPSAEAASPTTAEFNALIAAMKAAGTMVADWTVTYTLTDITAVGQPAVIPNTTAFSATLTAAAEHTLPAEIIVTIGGVVKTVTTDYTWTQGTGVVEIAGAKVTGNIIITAVGVSGE